MRIFTASFATETNSFSPLRTGAANFAELWFPAGTHPDSAQLFSAPLSVARRECRARGWRLIEGLCTAAQAGGIVRRDTYEQIREQILADLDAAMPVDMVILGLHGASIAEGYPDCEGDLLARIRARVGGEVPVGALLDPHCHLSAAMTANADVLVCYKEYPHSDVFERAQDLWSLLMRTCSGEIRPVMSVADARMMTLYYTPLPPMRGYVDAMTGAEGKDGILSVSLIHGFPWGDTSDYGSKVLVISDADGARGSALAQVFAERLIELRGQTMTPMHSMADAVEAAQAAHSGRGPLVLGDFSDNAGAGSPSDSTFLLAALLDAGVRDAAVAFVCDPVAVELARAAGVGARLDLRIGGKQCRFSGPPLDLEVEVLHAADAGYHDVVVINFELGPVAVVRARGGIDIVLTTRRVQAITPGAFSDFGIDPLAKRVLVVKSMQHFYAGFSAIAERILYVDTPGAATMALEQLPFQHIDRSIWPFAP